MLKINNDSVTQELNNIHTKGFVILCYLLSISDKFKTTRTSLADISKYTGIKDITTIKKYLEILLNSKYILFDDDALKNKYYLIEVRILYEVGSANYMLIPKLLFIDNIIEIRDIGWSLLCLLTIYYNKKWGYCCLTYRQMMDILNISSFTTLNNYIKLLQNNNLITINNKRGKIIDNNNIIKELPNLYIVNHLL